MFTRSIHCSVSPSQFRVQCLAPFEQPKGSRRAIVAAASSVSLEPSSTSCTAPERSTLDVVERYVEMHVARLARCPYRLIAIFTCLCIAIMQTRSP